MPRVTKETAALIFANQQEIAQAATDKHYQQVPELAARYGPIGREKCLQDARYHISYLAEAILATSPQLFKDYVNWARFMLSTRNIPANDLLINLNCLKEAISLHLPISNFIIAAKYLNGALDQLSQEADPVTSFLAESSPLQQEASHYLQLLLQGKKAEASRYILDLVEQQKPVKEIYLYVFQPALYEIGRLWQLNEITVAQEHFCTAATQTIMSQLFPYVFNTKRNGLKLVATCIAGDLHEVGVRMVADFFEMEGWDTYYLGANVPVNSILSTLAVQKPDLLLLSATMTYHVRPLADLIFKIREDERFNDIKILVGGYPFKAAPELWRGIGADGFSADAQQALDLANELVKKN